MVILSIMVLKIKTSYGNISDLQKIVTKIDKIKSTMALTNKENIYISSCHPNLNKIINSVFVGHDFHEENITLFTNCVSSNNILIDIKTKQRLLK